MPLLNTLKFIINHPLSRGNRLASLLRFAQWQIGSRLVPGAVVHDWVNGCKLQARCGEAGVTGNIYTGLHEFEEMGFLLHFLRAGDLFADVGANSGAYTVLACAVIGARGVAFEPIPSAYRRLLENVLLNDCGNKATCLNQGVGACKGTLRFSADADTTNHALAAGEHCSDSTLVEMTSLDVALRGDSPTLMKIDVEGYETAVLEGARGVLESDTLKAVIMEVNGSGARYRFEDARLLDLMKQYGFNTFCYDPRSRSLDDERHAGRTSQGAGNTLFVRDRDFVARRLTDAPAVVVHGRRL